MHTRTPRRTPLLALACAVVALAACAPATGLQPDGSVVVRAERAGAGWEASVPPTLVARALVITRPWARPVEVPRGFVPPPGTCRVWRANLAPALQTPFERCPFGTPDVPTDAYLIRG
jgi:hypothetical protein